MSASKASTADPYAPPDDVAVNQAIEEYARAVREVYGPRVKGVYLFGSRARGDHTPASDADIAVVLDDGNWRNWTEIKRLTDIAYDLLVETGADVEAWPVRVSEWKDPACHQNPDLVRRMQRDQRPVGSQDG